MRICYSFASRTRPAKFFQCLQNIRDLSNSNDYFVWAKLDEDDLFADMYRNRLHEFPEVTAKWGLSTGKINAINRNLSDLPPFDIMMNQSDDFYFIKKGYDDIIRDAMWQHFPDTDGLLHFPDQVTGDKICTYQIVGKKYFYRTGEVYNHEYISVYADQEETDKAKLLNKYAFINDSIYEHRHFIWGYGEKDDLLIKTEDPVNYQIDAETYSRRKANNFYI